MLDKYILEKTGLISYSQIEISNIATTLGNLKNIINNEPEFRAPFLGGSYKRGTMVKGISDVDVYFQYVGTGNSQSALAKLKSCLSSSYPTSVIKQDKPSILADFNKIPINITPYKQDIYGNLSIPDKILINWERINFGELEIAITSLRQKNFKFIDLIKILKLWNSNYRIGLKNFEIEKRVCNLFLNQFVPSYSYMPTEYISNWMTTFFNNNGFQTYANRLSTLKNSYYYEEILKSEWLKFIENK